VAGGSPRPPTRDDQSPTPAKHRSTEPEELISLRNRPMPPTCTARPRPWSVSPAGVLGLSGIGGHLRPAPPQPVRPGRSRPVPQRLRIDSQIDGDPPERRPGTRLVQRDGVRLELRRTVLHDHEMSDLRLSRSMSQVSNVQEQVPCPAARGTWTGPTSRRSRRPRRTGIGGEPARHRLTGRRPGSAKHRVPVHRQLAVQAWSIATVLE
jgi:hypothetical protein